MKDAIKTLVKDIQTPSMDLILSDLTESIPDLPFPRLSALFQAIIKNVVRKCHYHQRRFMRSQTTERLRQQELAIRDGQVKYAIDKALGKYRTSFDFSVIQQSDEFVTMPREIHTTITIF